MGAQVPEVLNQKIVPHQTLGACVAFTLFQVIYLPYAYKIVFVTCVWMHNNYYMHIKKYCLHFKAPKTIYTTTSMTTSTIAPTGTLVGNSRETNSILIRKFAITTEKIKMMQVLCVHVQLLVFYQGQQ